MNESKKGYILISLLILIGISLMILMSNDIFKDKEMKIYNVSVITSGKSDESFIIMKEGMEQAALEMNTNIKFITLSEENNLIEQQMFIENEFNSGVDAILISPVDYNEMKNAIERVVKKVPIILIDSKVNSKIQIPYIGCNNYRLGIDLAERVTQMGNTRKNIAVVKSNLEVSSIKERYDGFMDNISQSKNTIKFIEISGDDQEKYNEAKSTFEKGLFDVVVTFDSKTLEVLGVVKKELERVGEKKVATEIYGVGGTSKITTFLEDDIIKATAVENEFNIGYLSMKMAVDKINGKEVKDMIIYSAVIDKTNMFSEENEKLLFQLVR